MRALRTSEVDPAGGRGSLSVTAERIVGVVLAGGRSQRMGGDDKSFLSLGGQTMIERLLGRLAPQVQHVVISANGAAERFASAARQIVPDPIGGFVGPLAGILGGMLWARGHAPEATHVATAAIDLPFLPTDVVGRLSQAVDSINSIAVASSRGRPHFVCGLWPVAVADDLKAWLARPDNRAVHQWAEHRGFCAVEFRGEPDPFLNINTPSDLVAAELWISKGAR